MTRFRPATPADSRACFDVFERSIDDLSTRTGGAANATAGDPEAWSIRRPLFDHLAATSDAWWVATDDDDMQVVGYARSIVRDGVRELTEFFVDPAVQTAGVGGELLARAMPAGEVGHRSIVATTDPRALSRYLRLGLTPACPIVGFVGTPSLEQPPSTDLVAEPIEADAPPLEALGVIDRATLGFRRDPDHRWLAAQRSGALYRRGGEAVAYGYHPTRAVWGGPYAAIDPADLPVLLAFGEVAATRAAHDTVTFDLPALARPAIDHVLARGFRIDPFLMLYCTDGPIDGLAGYCLTAPPFFA